MENEAIPTDSKILALEGEYHRSGTGENFVLTNSGYEIKFENSKCMITDQKDINFQNIVSQSCDDQIAEFFHSKVRFRIEVSTHYPRSPPTHSCICTIETDLCGKIFRVPFRGELSDNPTATYCDVTSIKLQWSTAVEYLIEKLTKLQEQKKKLEADIAKCKVLEDNPS